MLKIAILAFAVVVGAMVAGFAVKAYSKPALPEMAQGMPSLLELHSIAQVESLPVREVKEPF